MTHHSASCTRSAGGSGSSRSASRAALSSSAANERGADPAEVRPPVGGRVDGVPDAVRPSCQPGAEQREGQQAVAHPGHAGAVEEPADLAVGGLGGIGPCAAVRGPARRRQAQRAVSLREHPRQWQFMTVRQPVGRRRVRVGRGEVGEVGAGLRPDQVAEYLVGGQAIDLWAREPGAIPAGVRAAYLAACRAAVPSIVADYRASAGVDTEHDRADRAAGNVLRMPVTVLQQDWGAALGYDAAALWRAWAPDLEHRTADCGHFMAEEAPDVVGAALRKLLSR
ncbi:alpha/beta fold hydrolase [Streptomyces sp. 900105755]